MYFSSDNILLAIIIVTVPGLSSAVIEHYKNYFSSIDSLIYGISPGQKAPRGLATTQSILTYLGKPLRPWSKTKRFGWQDLYLQEYPELGKRWMANCDIPDLDLFPKNYRINNIQFSAGMESTPLHLGMWLMSYLVRAGLPLNLNKYAKTLLAISHGFDFLGTPNGGMHLLIQGKDKDEKALEIKWFIIAKNNDGPQIPCVPAIILTQKIMENKLSITGAMPCIGIITLKEYMQELVTFNIKSYEFINKSFDA